jgi:threonine dehydratase
MKIVVEPSGATPLAALLAGRLDPPPARIGVIVSGGNVDARRFAELVATQ